MNDSKEKLSQIVSSLEEALSNAKNILLSDENYGCSKKAILRNYGLSYFHYRKLIDSKESEKYVVTVKNLCDTLHKILSAGERYVHLPKAPD